MRDTICADNLKSGIVRVGVCALVGAWPGVALAHSPIAGIGTFYNALLHPLIVPGHALALVGLSLALGQQGRPAARLGLVLLLGAFGVGLGAAMALPVSPPPETGFLFLAAVIGGAVSIARPLPRWLIAVAAIAVGLLMGLDSRPDPAGQRDTVLAVAGLFSGTALVAILIAGTCLTLEKTWMHIGIRIFGSWIAAASVLVLALLLHSGRPFPALSFAVSVRAEIAA
jgi:urease accessory protein